MADDRVRLVEPLLAVLLQADERKIIAGSLAFLSALAPTPAENARFSREYLALLDRSSLVASHAQEALLRVDEAGLLEAETFTELCRRVLLRPEKKLVRAQLSGLDDAARRDPARAPRLVAAGLFGVHQDTGSQNTGERYTEVLPAVPEPRPVPGPAATAAEVAQEVAAVVAGDQDVAAFERALDGLVRHARSDRAGLVKALKPVMRKEPHAWPDCQQADIYDVARALRGEEPRWFAFHTQTTRHPAFTRCGAMLAAPVRSDGHHRIRRAALPAGRADPGHRRPGRGRAGGAARGAGGARCHARPGRPGAGAAAGRSHGRRADTARRRGTALRGRAAAGAVAARRGLAHQDSTPEGWYHFTVPGSHEPGRPGTAIDPSFPPVAAALVGPYRRDRLLGGPAVPFWVAQLPHHRDEVVARDYTLDSWNKGLGRRRTQLLPFVAEAGGPAGYAVHFALAKGMETGPQGDDATVDALLVLAARGQLNTGLLGRQLDSLLRARYITASRVAAALRAAAETGAYHTVWAVIEAALPGLLGDTPVKEAAVFLSLAVDCVSRCGAKGEIAEVTAVAERGGSSQTVKNARLLRDALR